MAKRFTDSEKWKKVWFTDLSPEHKCLWSYMLDTCSTAGVWEPNWKVASANIGVKLDPDKARAALGKQICVLECGKWLIVDFITFQYGRLNPNNPAHKGAIEELRKYGVIGTDFSIVLPINDVEAPSKPLIEVAKEPSESLRRDQYGLMVMDMVMVKGKGMGKEGGGAGGGAIEDLPPDDLLARTGFSEAWGEWEAYRREIKKPLTPRARRMQWALLQREDDPVSVIHRSIRNQWQGLFESKEGNGTHHRTSNSQGSRGERKTFTLADIERSIVPPRAPG